MSLDVKNKSINGYTYLANRIIILSPRSLTLLKSSSKFLCGLGSLKYQKFYVFNSIKMAKVRK